MDFHSNLAIVLALTVGFSLASIFGYITHRLKISPILGYLLAGYIVGPYSPGLVLDLELSEQLAEIGVVLMMFGVGKHFKWQDLIKVKNIAISGALGQTFVATTVGTILLHLIGFPLGFGLIVGFAISVASTVVLVRVLSDNNLLDTSEGHVSVGWLVMEDILTVIILILLPIYARALHGMQLSFFSVTYAILIVVLKLSLLGLLMFTLGKKAISFFLFKVARTRSHELFTLTVLALTFAIATGSALFFGTSIALGAFIAGMVIGQTEVKHQASAFSLPIKDAFVVLFFLSVGMLFDPQAISNNLSLFLCVLFVILIVKPIAAYCIVLFLKRPEKTAVTVALALAQIGEFSFILAEEAMNLNILPNEGYDVIVACALISISINPILFRKFMKSNLLKPTPFHTRQDYLEDQHIEPAALKATIVGYGPIGQEVTKWLEKLKFTCTIIDMNVDTIMHLKENGKNAIFGDFSHPNVMEMSQIETSDLLVITVPEIETATKIIEIARQYKLDIPIIARATFTADKEFMQKLGVDYICTEDAAMQEFMDKLRSVIHEHFPQKFLS